MSQQPPAESDDFYAAGIDYAKRATHTLAIRDALWYSRLDHGDPRNVAARERIRWAEDELARLEAWLEAAHPSGDVGLLDGEPRREEGEPSMAYRGRLLYWHHNPDGPPYETLDVGERSGWTMLASGLEDILRKAPRDPSDATLGGGFTPHSGGPGVIGSTGA